jgi:hypothetical protein
LRGYGSALLWFENPFSRQHWSDPDDRTKCARPPRSQKMAAEIRMPDHEFSSPVPSSIGQQYNNRRGPTGFSLAGPFGTAHRNAEHRNEMSNVINATEIATRKKEQL